MKKYQEVFPTEYIPFTLAQREKAAATDLEEFLRRRGEKLLPAGRDKRLANDHSVTIRGSQWFDHGAETGGKAISFVMRYYGLDYPQAVSLLLDAKVSPAPAAEGYKCHGVKANLADRNSCQEGFDKCVELLGDLDILVVAHGIQRRYPSSEFPDKDWDDVINTNLNSVFWLARAAANIMKPKGYGKIILIASMCSFFGGKTVPAYSAAKGGVAQLAKAFSNDLLQYGININALAPGYMDTEMNVALTDPTNPKYTQQRYDELTQRIPAHRWGTGNDMKGPCIFLASHASDYLGGAIIPVDGGYFVM